jgi:hypothetical protein
MNIHRILALPLAFKGRVGRGYNEDENDFSWTLKQPHNIL